MPGDVCSIGNVEDWFAQFPWDINSYVSNVNMYTVHACMHACIHTYMHAYIHTYIHGYMDTWIHGYMDALNVHVCVCN